MKKNYPSIKDFISKRRLNSEIENELKRVEEEEQKTNRRKMLYKGHKNIYDFTKVITICASGNAI